MKSLSDRWRRQPTAVRVVALVVIAVVALNGIALALNSDSGPERLSGPASSTFTTGPRGLAAYASLLARFGHPVERSKTNVSDLDPPAHAVVIVLNPDALVSNEAASLRDIAERGGTVVVGGYATPNLAGLIDDPPRGTFAGPQVARPSNEGPETAGVTQVVTAGSGGWGALGGTSPLLGAGGRTLLSTASVGSGRILFLADPSPLQNRLLASGDNALMGLNLAGPKGTPVIFAESVHGFGTGRGLSALPREWQIGLAVLLLAAIVLVAARIRRLGPPEEPELELPPARAAYVEAMGLALARRGDPDAISEELRTEAVSRLARRTRVQLSSDATSIERAALATGLTPDQASALAGAGGGEDELVLVAEALSSLAEREDRS